MKEHKGHKATGTKARRKLTKNLRRQFKQNLKRRRHA
jgi:hypothetical protein